MAPRRVVVSAPAGADGFGDFLANTLAINGVNIAGLRLREADARYHRH